MEYDLFVTYSCNWNCDYCIVDTHNNYKNIEDVYREIENIKVSSRVCILGGEPGMLSEEQVSKIIGDLQDKNCTLELMTNGLFLERYPQYIESFDYILYHCSEDLEDDIKIYYNDNIEYQITVTDNNFKNIDSFFKQYPDIKFRVFGASKGPINKPGNFLSMKNKVKLAREYKDHITKESIIKILEACYI